VVLLDTGRVVAAGRRRPGRRRGLTPVLHLRTARPLPPGWLAGIAGARSPTPPPPRPPQVTDTATVPAILAAALRAGGDVLEMTLVRPSLADAFFALTAARSATRTRQPPPPPDAHEPRRSARERPPAPGAGRRRLVFLTLAPIVVISVAGLSLATLYGAEPRAAWRPCCRSPTRTAAGSGGPCVSGWRTSRRSGSAGRNAAAARALVQAKQAAVRSPSPRAPPTRSARVAPPPSSLTDPVKAVDVAYVHGLAQELRHGLEAAAVEHAQHDLDAARPGDGGAGAPRARAEDLHRALDDLGARLAGDADGRRAQEAAAERELHTALAARQAARARAWSRRSRPCGLS